MQFCQNCELTIAAFELRFECKQFAKWFNCSCIGTKPVL